MRGSSPREIGVANELSPGYRSPVVQARPRRRTSASWRYNTLRREPISFTGSFFAKAPLLSSLPSTISNLARLKGASRRFSAHSSLQCVLRHAASMRPRAAGLMKSLGRQIFASTFSKAQPSFCDMPKHNALRPVNGRVRDRQAFFAVAQIFCLFFRMNAAHHTFPILSPRTNIGRCVRNESRFKCRMLGMSMCC